MEKLNQLRMQHFEEKSKLEDKIGKVVELVK